MASIILQTPTPSMLSLLQRTAEPEERIIPYHLQNLATWAYNSYRAVCEHSESNSSPRYLLAVELCEKVHIVLSRYLQEEVEIPTLVHGDLMSALLIVHQMSFRDAVQDIYQFTERHFNRNALMRLGESLLQVDARTIRTLTTQLRQSYDELNGRSNAPREAPSAQTVPPQRLRLVTGKRVRSVFSALRIRW